MLKSILAYIKANVKKKKIGFEKKVAQELSEWSTGRKILPLFPTV
jgi:hypothetical protein